MRHRHLGLLVVVVALASVSLTATTSLARYRATLGPRQCCATHCKHHHPVREAEAKLCCTNHLAVLTQAASTHPAPKTPALVALLSPALSLAPATSRPVLVVARHGSRPPPHTLVAQHTSLLR